MRWLSRVLGVQKGRGQGSSTSSAQEQLSGPTSTGSTQPDPNSPSATQEVEHTRSAGLDQALYQARTPEEAEALIKKGANVNAKNTKNGWPCIYMCAYLAGHVAHEWERNFVYILLKHGAEVDVWTPEGNTPLGVAVMHGDWELVRLFVEYGADVNFYKPDGGRMPLHVAAINGNVPLAEYLIERGAKVDAKDATGKMPVDYAREYNEEATVEFLAAQAASEQVAARVPSDDRPPLSEITEEMILNATCKRCSKSTTRQSLTLYAGNDFYVCPKCAATFCEQCIPTLPLTGSPGYAKCPACDIQLKRAIPGAIG